MERHKIPRTPSGRAIRPAVKMSAASPRTPGGGAPMVASSPRTPSARPSVKKAASSQTPTRRPTPQSPRLSASSPTQASPRRAQSLGDIGPPL